MLGATSTVGVPQKQATFIHHLVLQSVVQKIVFFFFRDMRSSRCSHPVSAETARGGVLLFVRGALSVSCSAWAIWMAMFASFVSCPFVSRLCSAFSRKKSQTTFSFATLTNKSHSSGQKRRRHELHLTPAYHLNIDSVVHSCRSKVRWNVL